MFSVRTCSVVTDQIFFACQSILPIKRKNRSGGVNDNSCDNACREIILKGVFDNDKFTNSDDDDDDDGTMFVFGWTLSVPVVTLLPSTGN